MNYRENGDNKMELEYRLREGFKKAYENRHKAPPSTMTFKDKEGDYLEFETDGGNFWFDITPKDPKNKTLQSLKLSKAEFLRLLEYLKKVEEYL